MNISKTSDKLPIDLLYFAAATLETETCQQQSRGKEEVSSQLKYHCLKQVATKEKR